MPLVKNTPEIFEIFKDTVLVEERTHNAIKIVATTPDNELNITPLFIEEGFYNSETKKFTSYKIHDEIYLDAETFDILDREASQIVGESFAANNNAVGITCYEAEKTIAYKYVAERLGISLDSYTVA